MPEEDGRHSHAAHHATIAPVEYKDHFSDRASTYAARRPTYPYALVEYLARLAPSRQTAWDCGCGSGQMSVPLASFFDHVIATDASAEQIRNATPHAKVEYAVAPAEKSGLRDASVDFIVVAQSAHWFNLPKFYDEVRRVAKPRAILALVTYDLLQVTPEIDRIVGDFYRSLPWPPERRLVDERYRNIPFPFPEVQPGEFFITARWTVDQFLGYVQTWSGFRDVDAGEFERAIREGWGTGQRESHWPISMRIGRVG
jgi:SAM-dependent methyltransferase